MVATRIIEMVIHYVTLVVAYLIAETLSGAFRAWVAEKAGDDTPAELGFLTLNPLVHIDPLGMMLLLLIGFGWGRYIPIDFSRIHAPFRALKMIAVYFSDTVAHLTITIIALIILLRIFDLEAFYLALPMIFTGNISLMAFTTHYPHSSSAAIVSAIILVAIIYLSLLLAVLNFIMNSCRLGMLFFFKEDYPSAAQSTIAIILPMIFIFLVSPFLRLYAVYGLLHLGHLVSSIPGA